MPKYLDQTGLAHYHGNVEKRPVQTFDTVAQMQAATWLKAGMTCHTNGFHSAGDGGAAYYTVGTTGTANGMNILACQGGLNAVLVIADTCVSPEQFGAYGDGTHDDATCIQRCIDFATARGYNVMTRDGKMYLTSAGITVGNVDLILNSPILYSGSGTALTIGTQATQTMRHSYKLWVTSGNVEYEVGSVGVQVYNASNCVFDIHIVSGFEHGVVFSGYDAGCGYNTTRINLVLNCMYPLTLRSDGTSGWCNENYFYGGRLAVESSATYRHTFVGITIDSDYQYYGNANTFESMSIENAAVCVHVVYGNDNEFKRIRTEGATLTLKTENGSNWNHLQISHGNSASSLDGVMDVVDGGLTNYQAFSMPVFDSGFLPAKSFSNGSWCYAGPEVCFMKNNGALDLVYTGVKYNDHLKITSRNIGVMVDTTVAKSFHVMPLLYDTNTCRVGVVMYDVNGNVITSGLKSNSNNQMSVNTSLISGVTCFLGQVNTGISPYFTVPDSCVKAFMFIAMVDNVCGFRILSNSPYAQVIGNQTLHGLAAIPTCEGKAGDFCPSTAAGIVGWRYDGTTWNAVS